ncbi:MAG: MBOAT family O-acyltransferase [Candidatus Cryptobacteroides sp.]
MGSFFQTGSFSLASGWFLVVFTVFLAVYSLVCGKKSLRNPVLLVFSLFLYWKLSGLYVLLLSAVALLDWQACLFLSSENRAERSRKLRTALSVAIDVAVLVFFKCSGLFASLAAVLAGEEALSVKALAIPAGVSFFIFQSISCVIDAYRRSSVTPAKYTDYLLLLSFFPKMVLGPIVRCRDFVPQLMAESVHISNEDMGKAARLIASGIVKYCVIAKCVGTLLSGPVFAGEMGNAGSVALIGAYAFAIRIYCDFSGYTDLASGISLLMGFRLPLNFDAPYKSATITEFWRRWHISLSSWLRDYLYISLGGNRKGTVRTYINLIITMFLGGLWHGVGLTFAIWGLLHGLSLALHKVWLAKVPGSHKTGEGMGPVTRLLSVLLTFHIVLVGWIFFTSSSAAEAFGMIASIFNNFNAGAGIELIHNAIPAVFIMLAGYVLHFLPSSWNSLSDKFLAKSGVLGCAIVIAAAIWIALQSAYLLPSAASGGLPIYANF